MKILCSLIVGLTFAYSALAAEKQAEDQDILQILETDSGDNILQERQQLTVAIRNKLGKPTAEQNIFLSFIDKNDFARALYQWWPAFEKSSFGMTPTGRALFSFLLYKNGLEVTGVETLFMISNPKPVLKDVRELWKLVAPAGHPVWSLARIQWKPAWTNVFDSATEVQVLSREAFEPSSLEHIIALLKKTKLGSRERAWMEWQMGLGLSLQGQAGKAAKVLSHLISSKQQVVSPELLKITAARMLYENGYLDAAIQYYERVEKDSEYWFVAQEEKAWAYIRKGEPQNTLATVRSLLIEEFEPHVGPEAVFLNSLGQLKVCDYPQVLASIKDFSRRFRPRVKYMMSLASNADTKDSEALLGKLKKERVRLLELGKLAYRMPRYVGRDEVLYGLVQTQKTLENEADKAGALYSLSLENGTSQVGFQARLDELRLRVEHRARTARNASLNRLKELANAEVKEIHRMLQKMHIVEAEVIQQISLVDRVKKHSSGQTLAKLGSTGSKAKDTLRFPFEGETWFDELSNYKVDIKKGCVAKKEAAD